MSFAWNFQKFDSQILGFSCAKITSLSNATEIPLLIKDLIKNRIKYATYRITANNMLTIQSLEKQGFLLVDAILALEMEIDNSLKSQKNIFIAKESDAKELVAIAGKVFYANRFFNDPLIARENANKIYEEWLLNSLKKTVADEVLVYKNKKLSGFITLQKSGHIPLIGVLKADRGKGIGKALVLECLRVLSLWGVKRAFIETQISNIPAIRSYQHCGFKIINSFVTLRWSNIQ